MGVEWRRGLVRFPSAPGVGQGDLVLEPFTFGVVREYTARGGAGAIYMGLVKDRQPRIRTSLLEQTDVQGMRFNFMSGRAPRSLSLSNRPFINPKADAIPLVDLRPLGAPLGVYACRIRALVVNGRAVELERPSVAIIDTGTTGKCFTSLWGRCSIPSVVPSIRISCAYSLAFARQKQASPSATHYTIQMSYQCQERRCETSNWIFLQSAAARYRLVRLRAAAQPRRKMSRTARLVALPLPLYQWRRCFHWW